MIFLITSILLGLVGVSRLLGVGLCLRLRLIGPRLSILSDMGRHCGCFGYPRNRKKFLVARVKARALNCADALLRFL